MYINPNILDLIIAQRERRKFERECLYADDQKPVDDALRSCKSWDDVANLIDNEVL